jgi:glutamyl-tRNA reductase
MSTTSKQTRPAESTRVRARLALVGCNHRTASVELRERVSFTGEQAVEAAEELRRRGILEEAVVVSTCNRSELYGVPGEAFESEEGGANAGSSATDEMEAFFTSYHGIPGADLSGRIYRWSGADALHHLFRVAAGLDSMMLGEAEILGQLKTAYGQALERGLTGPILNRAFQGALEVGKRVRAETEVGTRPMSVSLAGVKLAERVYGNLKGHAALILGAGAVAEQVIEHLRNREIGSLRVVNRSFAHAAELASRTGGEPIAWESLESVLAVPDIIVTSVGTAGIVLTREMLNHALAKREGRPIFVVDLGMPRNVDPDATGIYSLYLYNIDDLGEIVEQNRRAREAEIPRAEAIIASHITKFESWRAALEASSIVDDLRRRFRHDRERLLRERVDRLEGISPEERERHVALTNELIERILETPAARLRNGGQIRGRLAAIEAVRHLFGLDEEASTQDKGRE